MDCKVYFNVKTRRYSIQRKINGQWRVCLSADFLAVKNATFNVSKAGVDRIRLKKCKEVIATINGILCIPVNLDMVPTTQVRFNPYEMYEFQLLDGTPIYKANMVYLTPKGVFV